MCGIAGLVDLAGLDRADAALRMRRALDRLAPRGPDGEGLWDDAHCLFGHRRLAIVDLSPAGAQPMLRGGMALVFNGMIYNYRALRGALAALGHRFTSDSDTEVLLAGWRQWHHALLPKLEGMFAFALWDPARRELVLARDRFGKKPLIYRRWGTRLAFASDLVAAEHLAGAGALDPAALRWLFTLRYIPEPATALQGFAKLPPGHCAIFSGAGFALERWYDLAAAEKPRFAGEAEAARALRERVEAAVAARLVADVPVGAFLSGGIDSAIVAAAMRKASNRVRTYTVGFDGVPDYYEERPAAKAVADYLGTEHTEIAVGAAEALAAIENVFDGLDEPFADSSAIPTYLVSRTTRRHVTVALSGDGGDEVFGGYRKYQGELFAERYRAVPAPLRRGVIEPLVNLLPESKRHPLLEKARRLRRFVAQAGGGAAERQAGWMRLLPEAEIDELLGPSAARGALAERVEALRSAAGNCDPLNKMLFADLALGLPGDMLTKADRMSMASSLEVRCPFLDHRVVEAAAAMPGAWKLKRGEGKAILRRAFADALPAEVFRRPKKGFEVPIALWLTGPLRSLVETALDAKTLAGHGIAAAPPRRWLAELESGRRDSSEKLWTLVAFTQWAARRGPALRAAA
ncbi:MAG TPA: asparagine synthase (glutamine-hydrolyzing) [Alphaproteobacteria bacterium]|jgi:asparagine synthase (glutamine-hydrolysing)